MGILHIAKVNDITTSTNFFQSKTTLRIFQNQNHSYVHRLRVAVARHSAVDDRLKMQLNEWI